MARMNFAMDFLTISDSVIRSDGWWDYSVWLGDWEIR